MNEDKKLEEQIITRLINSLLSGGKEGMKDGLYNLVQNGTIIINSKNYSENIQFSSSELPIHVIDENIDPIRKIINNDGLAGFASIPGDFNASQHDGADNINLEKQSIYAPEHRTVAMVENDIGPESKKNVLEQPRARVLEKGNSAPNPWGDVEIVTPGQLKL